MPLSALILVGGYGTRLRPLSFSTPKPIIEFVNKPIVLHQIEALAAAGVKHVVLAVNYKPQALADALSDYAERLNIKISFSLEETPLGTAGPIRLAEKLLDPNDPEPFFMLNADVSCAYPFQELLAFHRNHGKEGTIMVTRVDDPSKYGVVIEVPNAGGQIERFVEKPQEFVSDKINAGLYIFNKDIIKRIQPNTKTSIERAIFPAMATDGQLFQMVLPGYWMDIGQPADYLIGQRLHLNHIREKDQKRLASGDHIVGNVIIDPSAKIGNGCLLGPDVVIGPNAVVEDGARIRGSVLFAGARVRQGAMVADSMIGWASTVGRWARLESDGRDITVLGEDVAVKDEISLLGVRVCPHKGVKASAVKINIL